MQLRVLGPLEVSGQAESLRIAAPRQRVVLAMLLLEANHVVPMDRLIDGLWDDAPPSTARGQVQICVSALRRRLAEAGVDGGIVTRPPGYVFRTSIGQLDLHLFDELVGAGRAALAGSRPGDGVDLFRQALSIWRGPPLADVASRLVEAVAIRLWERRLAVVEECIDTELTLGNHHGIIGELVELTADHPIRERLHAQLMLALYRDGRQSDALDVYRRVRQALVSEVGLEPGRELRRLEHAILAGDPDLDGAVRVGTAVVPVPVPNDEASEPPPPASPHLLPADIADFTGRSDIVEQTQEFLVPTSPPARSRPVAIVAISGKGGAGKTATAVHLAHEVSPEFPDGQLYVTLHGGGARAASPSQVLGRFLRALGVSGTSIPAGLDERAEIYRDRLAGRRMLVVLDDAVNEEQIRPLLPGAGSCAVIVTSRSRLTGLAGAYCIDLGTLTLSHAIDLLGLVAGAERFRAEPAAARSLVKLCDSLPLALRIVAARLAARPHWSIAKMVSRLTDEDHRLDELAHGGVGVRTTIAAAYEGLSAKARRLFRRLGILEAPGFAGWVSVALLDVEPAEAEEALESLVDIQLLEVERTGSGAARYRFHDLIRVFARERLAAEESSQQRRDALRRAMGSWLFLAGEAHRREYGGDFTVLHGQAPCWRLPATVVDELLVEPLEWYEVERLAMVAAVRQAAGAGLDEMCWDLAITTVALFEAHGYLDDWRETHEIALAASRRAKNVRGEAAMLYSLGSLSLVENRFDEAGAALELASRLFAKLGDAHGGALAERNLAFRDRVCGDLASALDRYERAVTELHDVGDAIGEAHVMSNMAQVRIEMNQHSEAEHLLTGALDIARSVGARRVEAQILHRLGETFVDSGDHSRAGTAFESALSVVRATRDRVGEAHALHGLGMVQVGLGQHGQAELTLGRAHRMATHNGERLLTGRICLALADVHRAADRPDDAVRSLIDARRLFDQVGAKPWIARATRMLRDATMHA